MLSKSGNGENWQLTYTALNQVTQANITTPQGASVINYAYDHGGIRIGKTINGTEVVQYMVDKNRPYAPVLEDTQPPGLLSSATYRSAKAVLLPPKQSLGTLEHQELHSPVPHGGK
jgi:hypothetical protein